MVQLSTAGPEIIDGDGMNRSKVIDELRFTPTGDSPLRDFHHQATTDPTTQCIEIRDGSGERPKKAAAAADETGGEIHRQPKTGIEAIEQIESKQKGILGNAQVQLRILIEAPQLIGAGVLALRTPENFPTA